MSQLGDQLRDVVRSALPVLLTLSGAQTESTIIAGGWSAKQVLGHLIDSAANNHQRFVRAQFTDDLVFAGYDQEQWIRVQRYDASEWSELVEFWKAYNLHLAHVVDGIPEAVLTQVRRAHSLDKIALRPVPVDEPTTLQYLVEDYLAHLGEHLRQLFDVARA